ncbi:Cytoplasmic protein [Ceratobasidium theobromae]|uniref:Cytoplasmic protein n=1 Tax=Ceratobasidium theobromae TaxID=1582974 RepID=A0A5N5QCJ0_9AGAM|nr:Cytoplasmic protein [Ceratobasidium theobromae]
MAPFSVYPLFRVANLARGFGSYVTFHLGYTLGELLHLARSTAPMQRAMALDALARLTARVGRRELGAWFPRAYHPGNQDLSNRKQGENKIVLSAAELRKLVIESAVSALVERGAVGTRAVDCLYAALVVWDHQLARVDDVELTLQGVDIEGSNLHIMPSNYTVPDSGVSREIGLDEMKVVDSLDLDAILGTITRQLGARSLPISVLKRLLEIVVRLARQSQAHASSIVATPGLIPEIMRLFVLSGSPHPDSSGMDQPNALAIRLLIILARSSRQNASTLLDPADSLLRFVAVLPPVDVSPTVLVATLDLYAVLGRYGMYAHIATVAADSFDALSRYVRTRQDPKLTRSWIRLRAIWITCATDPHSTTPPHEILWSQVEGWRWGEDTIAWARDHTIDAGLLAEVWNALSSYLGGAIVNGVRGGAAERDQVTQALKVEFENGKARNFINLAVSRLGNWLSKDESIVTEAEMYIDDTWLLYSALRLDNMLLPPPASDAASTSSPLNLPLESIAELMNKVALNPGWLSAYSQSTTPPHSYAYLTNLALCLGYYLLLVRQIRHLEGMEWLKLAFITLHLLNPSCADIAARLLQGIGATAINEPSLNHLAEHLKPAAWDALLPFLLHELQPSAETIVSPPNVSTASISHVATQLLPSRPVLIGKSYGLPARNDWTMNPLDHLLRSGTSPVFKALPKEWDSDEVDVVRTTLALASARQEALRDSPFHMTSEEIVFGCMRVFMLEHGQPHDDSSSEIFRDSHIERMMGSLLSEISLGSNRRDGPINMSPLETIAGQRLSGQPFYQFYTDLVGLYDAISFAHPLFSRVLLPPLSMNYETDYRRLFWGDYGHILRSIQTELADVPSNTLDEWLWPRDKDGEMIGWYLKGLMKGGVQGFLRFIAVHHVATSIWPDFHNAEGEGATEMSSKDEDRTRMIIGAMVHQAGPALLSAVMLYEQRRKDPILYPACYEGRGLDRERRSKRLEWAVTLCGDRVRGRLEHIYNV